MRTALRDDLITLRPFEAQDVFELYAATRETIQTLCQWMVWCRIDYSLDDCKAFLSRAGEEWDGDKVYNLAIVDTATRRLCGSIALNQINRTHHTANVGYWVRQSEAGRGLASRALQLVARFGLSRLSLRRIEILVPHGNLASQRVAQKAGASFEGVLQRKLTVNNRSCDGLMYSMVGPLPSNGTRRRAGRGEKLPTLERMIQISSDRLPKSQASPC